MQLATGNTAAVPEYIEPTGALSRLDVASEQSDTIDAFHQMHANSVFGMSDHVTRLDSTHHRIIDNFHYVSQTIEERRTTRQDNRSSKGRGKDQKGKPPSRTPSEMHATYFGNNSDCSFCTYASE